MTSSLGRIAVGILLVTVIPARPSMLAAPQVIVLNGGPLHHRVALTDFDENLQLMVWMSRVVQPAPDSLRNRPRIRVAMYWGAQWRGRGDLPDSVSTSLFGTGVQAGAFYPAWRGRSPIWVFGAVGGMRSSSRA